MNLGFIILAYGSLLSLSFLDNGRGAAYPEILEHFSISTDLGSYLFSLVSFSGLLTNITARYWLSYLGLVKATRFALLCLSIGAFGMSFGASNNSYSLMLSMATFAGLGLGALGITMNVMVSEGAPLKHRRRFLSGLHGVYGIGSFLAPQLLNLFIFFGKNWITYFQYISLISITVLVYSFFVNDTHKEHAKKHSTKYPLSLIKRVCVGLFLGFYVASELLISSRLPLFLTRARGFSLTEANSYLSFFFISLMSGRLLFALVPFKYDNSKLLVFGLGSTLVIFSLGVFYSPVVLCLTGLTMSYLFPVGMDWMSEKFGKYNHIMVASVMTTIGITLSLMHWGFGQITQAYGVEKAFYCFYFFSISTLIFFIISSKFEVKSS